MPPKKPKKQQEPDDQFMKMIASELDSNLKLYKDRVGEIKSKRNYIQMDRDMVEQFYHNTQLEINQVHTKIINFEADAQKMQNQHNTEVKVYLQRLKLLEYEQEKANIEIEGDGQEAKLKEKKYFDDRMKEMKKNKQELKKKQLELEVQYIKNTGILQSDNKRKIGYNVTDNQDRLSNLEKKYQDKLARMKEQLQLKLRVQIHQLEERKNLHINELMKNHEDAFAQLKNYYNDITRDNLKLIKDHKMEIKKINQESEKNKKQIGQFRSQNNDMKQPLQKRRMEKDRLQSLLRQFEKHKMSLQNYKSKKSTLRDKVDKLQRQFAELSLNYDKKLGDRKDLSNKFEALTKEVKKHAQMHNVVLTRKLQTQIEQLQQKQAQLHQLMQNSALEPNVVEQIKNKVKESIENKNQNIKSLKYSIHHATKAYNDAIRVYQAKLVQFGIPAQELGFQPLQTITSTMPAGLVSS